MDEKEGLDIVSKVNNSVDIQKKVHFLHLSIQKKVHFLIWTFFFFFFFFLRKTATMKDPHASFSSLNSYDLLILILILLLLFLLLLLLLLLSGLFLTKQASARIDKEKNFDIKKITLFILLLILILLILTRVVHLKSRLFFEKKTANSTLNKKTALALNF